MKPKVILCMFSGGVESTGALHRLITDPDYRNRDLCVHHIILQNRENRAQAELDAVATIIDYYRGAHSDRPFVYTESVFNTNGFAPLQSSRFPFDMDVCAFLAANLAVADKRIREIAFGRTQSLATDDRGFELRQQRAMRIFKSVYSLEREMPPNYIFPVINLSKAEVWRELPEQVRQSCWYCRCPQYQADGKALPCGQCQRCLSVTDFNVE